MPNTFKGGIKITHRKPLPQSFVEYLSPEKICIPLPEGYKCTANIKDQLSRGDIVARRPDGLADGEYILCSVSGTVSDISNDGGRTLITVVSDGLGSVSPDCCGLSESINSMSTDELRSSLARRGVSLPTPSKKGIEHLVISCCEPCSLSSSSSLFVSELYRELVGGASIVMKALGVREAVFATPRSFRDCEGKLSSLLRKRKMMSLRHVSDKHPQSDVRLLVSSLFNIEINTGTDPISVGFAVVSADTCVKAYEALANGNPATYSFFTLNEEDIFVSRDICAPNGTQISFALSSFGIEPDSVSLIMKNGKAGGRYVSPSELVDGKTNAITLFLKNERPERRECIGCGKCNDACPAKITPSLIYEYGTAGNKSACKRLNVLCCIGCFCCDEVCPSGIPLTDTLLKIRSELLCREVSK